MKVLVVEDTESMRRIVSSVLKGFGFKDIQEAVDGKEGLARLRTGDSGLVIADWNMPELTGIDMLRTIRQDSALSEIPVVMLTARSEKKYIQEALDAGVSGYIVKPIYARSPGRSIAENFQISPPLPT